MALLTGARENRIDCCAEISSEPVHFCCRIQLVSGITLLYDDQRGLAEGSDGRLYYAVCRELPGTDGDIEVIGWSAEAEGEIILE